MELSIEKNNVNKSLQRKEIEFTVKNEDKTPAKADLKQAICKKLSLNPETTVIMKAEQAFGRKETKVIAHSYDTKEAMSLVPEYIKARIAKAQEKTAAPEKPKEAPAEEKAAEEKK